MNLIEDSNNLKNGEKAGNVEIDFRVNKPNSCSFWGSSARNH
jgi:hypothetical protein